MKLFRLLLPLALSLVSLNPASANPTMRLSADGGFTWLNVEDNGPLDANSVAGAVEYIGPIGNWFVNIDTGFGSPLLGSPTVPFMDASTTTGSSQAANLIVQLSDTNFLAYPNETFIAQSGGFAGGTVTYIAYQDSGNVLFGTTATYAGGPAGTSPSPTASSLITLGPVAGDYQESNSVVVPNATGAYSLTLETVIVHSTATHSDTDSSLTTLPPPVCSGQIGDFVWQDDNQNGCQDAGEPGIPNVQVDLYSGCGQSLTFIKSTSTDANGNYLFDGLCAGSYTVLIHTPSGFIHTVPHQGCSAGGLPSTEKDSDCECTGDADCSICVTLPADDTIDLSIDCGYIPANPRLQLIKTSSASNAQAGQPITYYYAVTNNGTVTVTNINIIDDNGTPGDMSDDYYVNAAPFDLAPGEGKNFAISHISEPMCMSTGGSNVFVGTLSVNVLANGNVEVFFMQSQNLNDNRYGTGATAATGWLKGHKFGDLVGSDEATFLFTDGKGKSVLEFQCDYISQATTAKFGNGVPISYPSGYGSLGPNGGDGKMLIGNSSNVLTCDTTFSIDLNQSPAFYNFKTNSPPETAPMSGISTPPGWNYVDGYHVIVSSNAFGANGFGSVTIPLVHNSPSKSIDQAHATNVCDCVTNTAYAFAVQGTTIIAQAYDDAQVCFSSSGGTGGTLGKLGGIAWNDGNKDGILQPTEKGMGGVNVQLLDCSGHQLAATKTDPTGHYQFANRAAGQYEIKFIPPPGQHFSPTGGDSDVDPTTGITTCITLSAGAVDLTWNAGLHK